MSTRMGDGFLSWLEEHPLSSIQFKGHRGAVRELAVFIVKIQRT